MTAVLAAALAALDLAALLLVLKTPEGIILKNRILETIRGE